MSILIKTETQTEYKDKNGKPIRYGDTLKLLGKYEAIGKVIEQAGEFVVDVPLDGGYYYFSELMEDGVLQVEVVDG